MSKRGVETEQPLITHIVGARPNFPKAAPVIRALAKRNARQRLVHTGQHYDDALSASFFRDLDLPTPDADLGVGSGTHAQQTATLLTALENEVTTTPPGLLVVYGDINSTMAAALVAAKLDIPLAHVEAGLRSFDRNMPEEINRVVTDQLSTLLFTTSPEAEENLVTEGIDKANIHFVGNPMIDTLLAHREAFDSESIRSNLDIQGPYAVVTLHRPSNVDDSSVATELAHVLQTAAELIPLVIPLHPRGRQKLSKQGLLDSPRIQVIEPLSYLDFISLVQGSRAVITDSGGVQEETTMLGIPCLTLRPNTERPITITQGTNQLIDIGSLVPVLRQRLTNKQVNVTGQEHDKAMPPLWDGHAGDRIAQVIQDWLSGR